MWQPLCTSTVAGTNHPSRTQHLFLRENAGLLGLVTVAAYQCCTRLLSLRVFWEPSLTHVQVTGRMNQPHLNSNLILHSQQLWSCPICPVSLHLLCPYPWCLPPESGPWLPQYIALVHFMPASCNFQGHTPCCVCHLLHHCHHPDG